MTNSSDRLDRIEQILLAVAQRQDAISQQQEINTRSIELLGTRIDSNAQAIAANSNRIAEVDRALAEAVGRALAGIEALTERAEEDRINFREYRQRNDATVTSINTAVERLDAILQQLLRRDRNGNGDQPQS